MSQPKCEAPEMARIIYEILSNFIFDLESYWAVSQHIEYLDEDDPSRPLWILFSNNCLKMATVEWCKVFGSERNNKTHYSQFIEPLEGIEEVINNMKEFRDKYISHYDFYNKPIPFMDDAMGVVEQFDKAMLEKYNTDNQESTGAFIDRIRKEIKVRLKSITGLDE